MSSTLLSSVHACQTMRPLLKGFEHTIISLRSSAINWSWAGDLFKSKNSSQASFERSRQGKDKFQQLHDNSLGVISAAKPADTRDFESAIGTSNRGFALIVILETVAQEHWYLFLHSTALDALTVRSSSGILMEWR